MMARRQVPPACRRSLHGAAHCPRTPLWAACRATADTKTVKRKYVLSEESRRKISEAAQRRWQRWHEEHRCVGRTGASAAVFAPVASHTCELPAGQTLTPRRPAQGGASCQKSTAARFRKRPSSGGSGGARRRAAAPLRPSCLLQRMESTAAASPKGAPERRAGLHLATPHASAPCAQPHGWPWGPRACHRCLPCTRSPETRAKMSAAQKERLQRLGGFSAEWRAALSQAAAARRWGLDVRYRTSQARAGWTPT